MFSSFNRKLGRIYATAITTITPCYNFAFKTIYRLKRGVNPKKVILLISRPQDIELLIGLHNKCSQRDDMTISFWVVDTCANRYPEVFSQLHEKMARVEQVVSYSNLASVMRKLMRVDVFLSTVESTAANNKLPYIITRLANMMDVSTYVLQHGFPSPGLHIYNHIYGSDIQFESKTVLLWGPVEALPAWVSEDTRRKCVAVGCPKELVLFDVDLRKQAGERPIIAIFESFHGHQFSWNYISAFLGHLQEAATKHKEFQFILKSHPASARCRSKELSEMFSRLKDVEIVDRVYGETPAYSTPWLLSNAIGVISTPSTIALDAAMFGVPVALARYNLELAVFSPLDTLNCYEDWETYLSKLENGTDLQKNNEELLRRLNIPGDAVTTILDRFTEQA